RGPGARAAARRRGIARERVRPLSDCPSLRHHRAQGGVSHRFFGVPPLLGARHAGREHPPRPGHAIALADSGEPALQDPSLRRGGWLGVARPWPDSWIPVIAMGTDLLLALAREALLLMVLASAPAIGASLVVGFLMSVFQAATSLQEQTLSVVPKLCAA